MPNMMQCRTFDEFDQEQIEYIMPRNLIEYDFPISQSSTGAWEAPSCVLLTTQSIGGDYKNTAFVDQDGFEIFIDESPENRDPTIHSDLLKSKEDQIQELIYRIKTSILVSNRKDLANRLLALYSDAKEEEPESVGISAESLKSFYDFFQLHTNLKLPMISLTPDYNIYVSWRDEHNRVFSIHFLPNADARFVMFKPNEKYPERKIRISGSATVDILMETVATYALKEWILE